VGTIFSKVAPPLVLLLWSVQGGLGLYDQISVTLPSATAFGSVSGKR
jgi:hypothetical protein